VVVVKVMVGGWWLCQVKVVVGGWLSPCHGGWLVAVLVLWVPAVLNLYLVVEFHSLKFFLCINPLQYLLRGM
jgi:hypothetical protein